MDSDLESKKDKIRNFIRENPKTTYKKIRKSLHLKVERIYYGGMAEAFKDAGIAPPREFKRKSKEEKRRIIIDYIRSHPKTGGHTIKKDTKINFQSIFKNTDEAFEAAGIKYPRIIDHRSIIDKKAEIINIVKNNPAITIIELAKETQTKPYNYFNCMEEIYKIAGIKERINKKRLKKIGEIIEFIKIHPLATQREINNVCKTHVQEVFKGGIFEAYEQAGLKFPFERLKIYGVGLKSVRKRARRFEDKIATKLTGYGNVNRLVRTKRGIADIILERKNRKAIIEVKDYELKEISVSQINQLNMYLEDSDCNLGFLICYKKPKKDNFLIGKNKIIILEDYELSRIPGIIDKGA